MSVPHLPLKTESVGAASPMEAPLLTHFSRLDAAKPANPYTTYVCRGCQAPVFQRTRTSLPNYLAFRNARILPLRVAYSADAFRGPKRPGSCFGTLVAHGARSR